MEKIAAEEKGQLCLIRPQTPDIIVFSGNIWIVDRNYLGLKAWRISVSTAFRDLLSHNTLRGPVHYMTQLLGLNVRNKDLFDYLGEHSNNQVHEIILALKYLYLNHIHRKCPETKKKKGEL